MTVSVTKTGLGKGHLIHLIFFSQKPASESSSTSNGTNKSSSDRSASTSKQSSDCSASTSKPSSDCSASTSKPSSGKMTEHFISEGTLSAEVLWTLNTVNHHHSFNSNADVSKVFHRMFPDSTIAQAFGCGERKTSYMVTDGIAPYVISELKKSVSSGHFVLAFDESLNNDFQNKQLDLQVRLWDVRMVKTRYVSSSFMGHARAVDLMSHFSDLCKGFNLRDAIQVSMDGPKVNWKFYQDLAENIKSEHEVQLLNIGSCGLHKVHGSFKTAFQQSGWQIDSALKSFYSLFHNSPTRREDYTTHTESTIFPEHFCDTRWLENGKSAQRVLDILPDVQSYVKNFSISKSVSGIKKFLEDTLFSAKLAFFVSLAKEVEPFLTDYQTDRPMMPFMFNDLNELTISLLGPFLLKVL